MKYLILIPMGLLLAIACGEQGPQLTPHACSLLSALERAKHSECASVTPSPRAAVDNGGGFGTFDQSDPGYQSYKSGELN